MIINDASKIWLFDYDLTLYGHEEREVLNSLDHRISLFVQQTIDVSFECASEIRKKYWLDYGTTLAGLRAEHQVDPNVFFNFIHYNDGLVFPKESPEKRALLKSLNGAKFIFTNARRDWSDAGLSSMGIADCFDGIVDLKELNWHGKPSVHAYNTMEDFLSKQGFSLSKINSTSIVFLEDSVLNLRQAHERGWTTILVHPTEKKESWIDYQLDHLLSLQALLETPHV